MNLKLLELNVKNGFRNEDTQEFERHRFNLAVRLVREVNPDIFVAIESNQWGDNFKNHFGFEIEKKV